MVHHSYGGGLWSGGTIVAMVVAAVPAVAIGRQPPAASTGDVAARFITRTAPRLETYRARRRLEGGNTRFRKYGWLEVQTELGPSGFSYTVLAEGGADIVRKKALYPVLEGEKDVLRGRNAAALSEANYTFADAGVDGGWPRIRITPRRKDKVLVDGWLFVPPEADGFVEMHGRLAKSPSFWTTSVDIMRRQERVAGVWVPVRVESTASIRFAGQSTFSMVYTYETINGARVVEKPFSRAR
jgi:hypothetical protein